MRKGFTLAELLIALAILGVIAVFTIPKVLQSQQDGKFNAIGKEVAGMLAGALEAYDLENTLASSTGTSHLTSYINYVAVDSTSTVDHAYSMTTYDCSNAAIICLRLHNGAILWTSPVNTFSGTASTNAIWFYLDPDGRVTDGTTNGPGKSVSFWLYYNKRLRTRTEIEPNTVSGNVTYQPSALDPPWFSWD